MNLFRLRWLLLVRWLRMVGWSLPVVVLFAAAAAAFFSYRLYHTQNGGGKQQKMGRNREKYGIFLQKAVDRRGKVWYSGHYL